MKEAEVSFKGATALVKYDPARVSVPQMVKAVQAAGYGAKPIGNEQSPTDGAPKSQGLWEKIKSLIGLNSP